MPDDLAPSGVDKNRKHVRRRSRQRAAPLPPLTSEQQKLVRRHIALVGVHLATHVPVPSRPKRSREYNELFQEGCLGLARAAATYDPKRDGNFVPYALYRIRAAVHRAIHSRFTLVYVPARARLEMRRDPTLPRPPAHVMNISQLEETMPVLHRSSAPQDTVRHALRRRYELAVSRTLEHMRQRQWRKRNPSVVMECIAQKRILISSHRRRTTMRQIARDFEISVSRINSYERLLEKEIEQAFRGDPQVRELLQVARESPDGRDTVIDDDVRARLRQAEVAAFEERFLLMPPAAQAETIYSLIGRSTHSLSEIAKNLFSLTLSTRGESALSVA